MAEVEKCPLLTGDAALRQAAKTEQVEVRGTVWLILEMVHEQRITVTQAKAALHIMRNNGRRLPWDRILQLLTEFETAPPSKKERKLK